MIFKNKKIKFGFLDKNVKKLVKQVPNRTDLTYLLELNIRFVLV